MALPQGINFRASSGFVTDVSPATNEIALSPNYPRTTPQGNTVGWESALGNTRDRTTSNDTRLAGCAFDTVGGVVYRIDLPSAGNYNIRAAFGDPSSVNGTAWSLLDSSSVLAALATGDNTAANSFRDATNTVRTAAAWPGSNAVLAATFASTICRFRSDSAANNMIAHVYVETAGATGITGTLAKTEGADTGVATGSVLVSGALARTEGADSLVASGGPIISGAIAATEGSDTLVAQSGLTTSGSLAATEGADTLAAAGSIKTTGTVAATEGADTVAAAGAVGNAIGGSLAVAEGKDTAVATGGVLVAGVLAATETGDTLAASGGLQITGSLAVVEAPDTLFASSTPPSPSIVLAIYRTTTMDDTDEFGIAPLGSDWSSASTTIFSTDQFGFAAMRGADVCRSGSFL